MGDPVSTLGFAIIAILCCAIFFFSLAEAALLAANRQLIRQRAREGDTRAQALQTLLSQSDYLSSLIVAMNGSIIVISTVATLLAHRRLGAGEHFSRELLHLATIAVIMVFAELTPKTYASHHADQIAPVVGPVVAVMTRILSPIISFVAAISRVVLAMLRIPATHKADVVSEADIIAATDLSEEAGVVEPDEGALVDRIMELGDLTARDVMTPRVDVVGVDEAASLEEVLDVAQSSGFSRLPVYRSDIDHIVGIVLINDLLRSMLNGSRWQEHIRKALVVAESTPLSEVFRQMRQQRTHMAIVADEFGGTAGVVTVEDILEQLVGEIRDEHDTAEDDIVELADGQLIVAGRARLDEIYQRLGLSAEEDSVDTVAGLLAEITGHIPQVGESVEHKGITFVVEESDAQHVGRVRVFPSKQSQGGDD